MNKKCKICKKQVKNNRNKYCSIKCKIVASNKQKLEWNKRNPLKMAKYKKRYYLKTKDKWLKYNKNYKKTYNKKYKKNPKNKLKERLRVRILRALKQNYKYSSTFQLLGCSIEFLKKYLKNKFKPGMTWKNHTVNGWHIDHIIPCCRFDLSKEFEQRKCFHYTNLQPLWAEENWSKGKYEKYRKNL